MWCVAELDEEYIRRMDDILAVYEKPLSQREPVVCLDEKPVVLHQDIRSPQAMRPGRVARRDGEYRRCGTANLFCGVEPKAGRCFPKVTRNRCSSEFADYLLDIAIRSPEADTIHLVLDNLSSHTRKAVVEGFGEQDGGWLWSRFTVHYAQAWKLVESSRDRDQPVLAPVPGPAPHRRSSRPAAAGAGMESPDESPWPPDSVELYTQTSTKDI